MDEQNVSVFWAELACVIHAALFCHTPCFLLTEPGLGYTRGMYVLALFVWHIVRGGLVSVGAPLEEFPPE